jgi:MFS family permease
MTVSDLLQTKYKMSEDKSAIFFGIPYEVGIIFLPPMGLWADKHGKRAKIAIIGSFFFIAAFTTSALLPSCDDSCNQELIPIVLIGLGYSIYVGVIWGLIPLVVKDEQVGTAFGIGMSFMNIGMTISPEVGGYIVDNTTKDFGYFG